MPIVAAALCLAVVAAVTGCGDGSEAAGAGDCQSVGDVTEVSDGPNDVQANVQVPRPPPPPPGLDLEEAAVARSDSEVCAEWTLRTPVQARTVFQLLLRQAGQGDSGALVKVSAAVLDAGETTVQLYYPGADERPDRGLVDGSVVVDGNRVSMRLDRSLLPDYPSLDSFEWEAETLAQPERLGPQYSDCTPERGNVAHPGGGVVTFENAAVCV